MRKSETESRPRAQKLRKELTRAEVWLWACLRRKQVQGARFRRQHPTGPYIADFAGLSARLVVEVDGATHWTPEELAHDARRTEFMEGLARDPRQQS